jgi:hypothetical protein
MNKRRTHIGEPALSNIMSINTASTPKQTWRSQQGRNTRKGEYKSTYSDNDHQESDTVIENAYSAFS